MRALVVTTSLGLYLGCGVSIYSLSLPRGDSFFSFGNANVWARFFEKISVGNSLAIEEFFWLTGLSELGQPNSQAGNYFEALAILDPEFIDVYFSGALALSLVERRNELAEKLFEKGFKRLDMKNSQNWDSRAWRLRAALFYFYFFENEDFEKATRALEGVRDDPDAPAFLRSLAERLRSKYGRLEAALRVIELQIKVQKEAKVIQQLEQKRRNVQRQLEELGR